MKTICILIFSLGCLSGFSQSEIPVEDKSQKVTQENALLTRPTKRVKAAKRKLPLKKK